MKSKLLRKMLAAALSASMIMGMSVTSLAADTVEVDAPIYAYDVVNVIVPTVYAVAFNPDGLDVSNGSATITDQIVSKNYGIINKSTKDKIVTVELNVEASDDRIEFVSSVADATTNAAADEYKIYLAAVPADATDVQVGSTPAAATEATTAAELADVTMTKAASNDVALLAGSNDISFALPKATYGLKSGETLDLGATTMAEVKDKFEVKSLAATGNKGITAFTFSGAMNTKADWSKLATGVKITAVYSNETAPDGAIASISSGTGAMYESPLPTFKSKQPGVIKYTKGTGTDEIDQILTVEMDYNGQLADGYNELTDVWGGATDTGAAIILSDEYMGFYLDLYPDDFTREGVITYTDKGGNEKTVTLDIVLRTPANEAPVFTCNAVGVISYTQGSGKDALVSISKVEMDYQGNLADGYHATEGAWGDATDVNGTITLTSEYIGFYAVEYPTDATREAVITYVDASGATKTATVDVMLK